MSNVRIVIADDHALMLSGLGHLLAPHYEIVGSADNGLALVQAAQKLRPDLIILDINMPVLNGIDALRQIREEFPSMKFVCLSMHSGAIYLRKAFEAGASAYVLKSGAAEELLSAIEVVLKGGVWISPEFGNELADEVRLRPRTARATPELTSRQRHILQLIAEGRSNREISDILCLSVKTVEFHRQRLMTKLGMHSVAELTRYAVQEGLAGTVERLD